MQIEIVQRSILVEDLMDIDCSAYSKELDTKRTIFASLYDANQTVRRDVADLYPNLSYRLAVCSIPSWTEFCWNGWTEDYEQEFPAYQRLQERNPEPWNAIEACRVVYEGGGEGAWYIRWEDRFVRLSADWELTEEQMGIIAEKLLHCAE
jgi:hypothetical protein